MKKLKNLPFILSASGLLFFGCSGISTEHPDNEPQSLSEIAAGLYDGNLKNMTQGISLGRYAGCIVPSG